jgi:hypothetical protein
VFIQSVNLQVEEAMQDNKIRLESEVKNVLNKERKKEKKGRWATCIVVIEVFGVKQFDGEVVSVESHRATVPSKARP